MPLRYLENVVTLKYDPAKVQGLRPVRRRLSPCCFRDGRPPRPDHRPGPVHRMRRLPEKLPVRRDRGPGGRRLRLGDHLQHVQEDARAGLRRMTAPLSRAGLPAAARFW